MSYLAQPTSTLDYGVVKIGSHINVADGVISLGQDLSPTADVAFHSLNATNSLTLNNISVITGIQPTAGPGISITGLDSVGPDTSFTVNNTGVLSITAGPGISIDATTGNITISTSGADLLHVTGVTASYTASVDDEYIGVSSASAVTITIPSTAPQGRVYTVKDEFGQGSGKITIQPAGSLLIDGKTNYVISVPYQAVSMVLRGTSWWII